MLDRTFPFFRDSHFCIVISFPAVSLQVVGLPAETRFCFCFFFFFQKDKVWMKIRKEYDR